MLKILVAATAALTLAACGGGGGGGGGTPPRTTPGTTPAPGPSTPAPAPSTPTPTPAPTPAPTNPGGQTPSDDSAKRGFTTATGIDRIPLGAIMVTNRQMARMYAIIEYKGTPSDSDGYSPPGNRRTLHSDNVRIVACHSYIRACEDPFGTSAPNQFHLGVGYTSGGEYIDSSTQMETVISNLAGTVKIVSSSFSGSTPSVLRGANLPFASIEAAGNEDRETFVPAGFPETDDIRNMRAAVAADKVLYVSGYRATETADGTVYERDGFTGCKGAGFTEGCIYAPSHYLYPRNVPLDETIVNFGGTSAATPHVASALASVLAVFPETTPQNLIRVAKACAIPTPSLPGGVGRADFTCMTKMGSDGQWRVLSSSEFAGLYTPDRMNALVFPGNARVSGSFVPRSGKPVVLATNARQAFSFAAGIPNLSPERQEEGLFPVADGKESVGIGYMGANDLFAAVTFGNRDSFFGLTEEYGYSGTTGLNAQFGHANMFARFSRQTSSTSLVREVEGDAMGLTARYAFGLTPATGVTLSAHMDRFTGGRADTVFGPVNIGRSPWNRSANLAVDHTVSGRESLSFTMDQHWQPAGDETVLGAKYRISLSWRDLSFKPSARHTALP